MKVAAAAALFILKTALNHGWTRMNTDKEELASPKTLTQTVSPPKRFLIRVYLCSSVVVCNRRF
jgi:hypothetical protein